MSQRKARGRYIAVPLEERFWEHVDKSGECWVWTGSRIPSGYGNLGVDGSTRRAHRVSWELANGPIPTGMWVLHRCDNPPCVHPAHLFLGTRQDNVDDMIAKGRYVEAPHGHGSSVSWAKLNEERVREIRRLASAHVSQRALAERYGVSQRTIGFVVRREWWRHVA